MSLAADECSLMWDDSLRPPPTIDLEKVGEDRLRAAQAVARLQIELCGKTAMGVPFGNVPSNYFRAFRRLADREQD